MTKTHHKTEAKHEHKEERASAAPSVNEALTELRAAAMSGDYAAKSLAGDKLRQCIGATDVPSSRAALDASDMHDNAKAALRGVFDELGNATPNQHDGHTQELLSRIDAALAVHR